MIEKVASYIIILVLLIIFWQDYKQRLVTWLLYPLSGILAYLINFGNVGHLTASINSIVNLCFVSVMLLITYMYSKIVMKKKFINESMGSGDVLLLIFLCFSFATFSFIVLLILSLIFSLALHIAIKNNTKEKTVPLAGYISLFFAVVYAEGLFVKHPYLFAN